MPHRSTPAHTLYIYVYAPPPQARQRLRDMAAMMKDYSWKVSEAQRANLIMVEENMTALENGVQVRERGKGG